MNLISKKIGFEYRLYFSPDGKYGTEYNGNNINGMIGEVFRNVSFDLTFFFVISVQFLSF